MGRIKLALFALASLFLSSCGDIPDIYCSANFWQGGFSARVSYVVGTLNTYEFQVCTNTDHQNAQVSVYGVASQFDIPTINPSADVRLPHLSGNVRPGDVFSVTFASDDSWFVIFEDDGAGDYDLTTEVLRGQLR